MDTNKGDTVMLQNFSHLSINAATRTEELAKYWTVEKPQADDQKCPAAASCDPGTISRLCATCYVASPLERREHQHHLVIVDRLPQLLQPTAPSPCSSPTSLHESPKTTLIITFLTITSVCIHPAYDKLLQKIPIK